MLRVSLAWTACAVLILLSTSTVAEPDSWKRHPKYLIVGCICSGWPDRSVSVLPIDFSVFCCFSLRGPHYLHFFEVGL